MSHCIYGSSSKSVCIQGHLVLSSSLACNLEHHFFRIYTNSSSQQHVARLISVDEAQLPDRHATEVKDIITAGSLLRNA